jgi:hypothetical protein
MESVLIEEYHEQTSEYHDATKQAQFTLVALLTSRFNVGIATGFSKHPLNHDQYEHVAYSGR